MVQASGIFANETKSQPITVSPSARRDIHMIAASAVSTTIIAHRKTATTPAIALLK